MMKSRKLVSQVIGNNLAIGVSGTPEQIRATMVSLYNWGAIEGTLDLGDPEKFCYGITTREKLVKYFRSLAMCQAGIDPERVETPSLIARFDKLVAPMLASIEPENFLHYGADCFVPCYRVSPELV